MCGISWRARWSGVGVGVPENGKDGGTIPGKSTIFNRRFSIFINGWKFPLSFHFLGCVQWRIYIMAKNHGKLWSNHFHSKANVENYTQFSSLKKGYLFEPLEMWQNIGLIGLKGFAIDIPRPTSAAVLMWVVAVQPVFVWITGVYKMCCLACSCISSATFATNSIWPLRNTGSFTPSTISRGSKSLLPKVARKTTQHLRDFAFTVLAVSVFLCRV